MRRVLATVAVAASISLSASAAHGQECLHKDGESAAERVRRDTAMRYLAAVNAAQTRAHRSDGRYLSLTEIGVAARTAPLGFVPRLITDRWSYVVSLKDLFDSCGFTLFTDEHGVIYESYPAEATPSEPPGQRDDDRDQ